jgi:GT2 family glycosyltransferase
MNLKIGIILLHFGKASFTHNCIRSILQSKYKNFQILVIDNCNAEVFREEVYKENLTVIRTDENLGFAKAMNLGLQIFLKQDIDYFLLLNNDTIIMPNTLDAFLTAATSNGNAIFAPIIFKINTDIPIEFGGDLNYFSMYFKDLKSVPNIMQQVSYVTGACLFFSRQTFEIMTFLPEEYFMYSEDMDYCIIARLNQIPLYVLPSAIIFHEKGASSGGLSPFTIYYIHRNRFLLGKKYHRGIKYISFLIYYNFLMLGKLLKWFFRKPKLVKWFWYGFIDGLKGQSGKSEREFPSLD